MFKWICLVVFAAFLAPMTWAVNEVRVEVRQATQLAIDAGHTVNSNLPEIVENVGTTASSLAELSADIRQLKELAGVSGTPRDKNLVAYAEGVMECIESADGVIGLKRVIGSDLKSAVSAKEWAVNARKEALFLTAVAKSKKEILTRLAANKFGSAWQIKVGDEEPVDLLKWLKAVHAPSRDL